MSIDASPKPTVRPLPAAIRPARETLRRRAAMRVRISTLTKLGAATPTTSDPALEVTR